MVTFRCALHGRGDETKAGMARGALEEAGHGELLHGGHGEPPWRERRTRAISAGRDGASEIRRCASARRSCGLKQLGGGGAVVMNCADEGRSSAVAGKREE